MRRKKTLKKKRRSHNITTTTRLVDTASIPMLLKTVRSKRIGAKQLIIHRFKLGQVLQAYDTFGKAVAIKALKVMIEGEVGPSLQSMHRYLRYIKARPAPEC